MLSLRTYYTAGIQWIKKVIQYTIFMFFFRLWTTQGKNTSKSQKTVSDEIYVLLDEVESDLGEDVNNERNNSDKEFLGNDEVD